MNSSCRCTIIKQGAGRDAELIITCTSKRFSDNFHDVHPISRLILQTLKSHVNSFFDHGTTFLFLCTRLVLDHLGQDVKLMTWSMETCLLWIQDFFQESKMQVDPNDITSMLAIVKNILAGNNLIDLSQVEYISIKVIEAFLKSTAKHFTGSLRKSPVKICHVISDEIDCIMNTRVINDLIMDIPIAPETRSTLPLLKKLDYINILIYQTSLDLFQTREVCDSNVGGVTIESSICTEQEAMDYYLNLIQIYRSLNINVVASQKIIHQHVKFLLVKNVSHKHFVILLSL